MLRKNNHRQFRTGMTLAALALIATAVPAQAQFNVIGSPFVPAGPTIGTPLGGGVLNNIGFGTGLNTGFGSFNTGFNSGFILPLNSNFNGQLAAFNNQRANTSNFLDFNSRLAQFNSNRTATNTQFSAFNSALNVPAANFEAPNPVLFPANQNLLANTFTQVNPSLNPLIVNGPVPGSVGFSSFNTLNALNPSATGFQTFNTLANSFGGAGVPVTAQIQNVRIARARPAFNPTLPGSFVTPIPQEAMSQHAVAGSTGSTFVRQVTTNGPFFANPRLDAQGSAVVLPPLNQTTVVRPITTYGPFFANPRLDAQGSAVVLPPFNQTAVVRAVTTYGPFFANPRLDTARVRPAFGMGSGITVMGGRSR